MSWTLWLDADDAGRAAALAAPWLACDWIRQIVVLSPSPAESVLPDDRRISAVACPQFIAGPLCERLLAGAQTDFLAVVRPDGVCEPEAGFRRRMESTLALPGGGMAYAHCRAAKAAGCWEEVVLPRFQPGSARDSFPTGPVLAFGMAAVREALRSGGPLATTQWGGLFELFLRLARAGAVALVPESLTRVYQTDSSDDTHRRHFAYLLPEFRARQQEMEALFTDHLRAAGAWLPSPDAPLPVPGGDFPVLASVVIPVRNRARTIGEAVESAAAQECFFPFNVLVVDNHSTDGTAGTIEDVRDRFPHVHRLVPALPGLGIGGCWQLAVESELCGQYAVQLDSDDLYAGADTLRRMVECLRDSRAALAVGSYRVVDHDLRELPPGVIDHREWTRDNGHNNLLRVEGIGAPRAFYVPAIRQTGFPDVSYGEDYAAALALSRRWPVGRVYDPVYLCRRWEGNSDSGLSSLQQARHHEYKDFLRTQEIAARRQLARQQTEHRTSNVER